MEFYRFALYSNYGSLGEILSAAGRLSEAAATIEERQQLFPQQPTHLVRMAKDYVLLAGRVGQGKAQRTPEEETQRQLYASRAVQLLRSARTHGWRDEAALRDDNGFALLRGRADFQQLIDEIVPRNP